MSDYADHASAEVILAASEGRAAFMRFMNSPERVEALRRKINREHQLDLASRFTLREGLARMERGVEVFLAG